MKQPSIPLPDIEKTDLMLLIEALTGRDVRQVVWDSYLQQGSYAGVARDLSQLLGREITRAAVQQWCIARFNWEDGLRIPGYEPEPVEPAGVAA